MRPYSFGAAALATPTSPHSRSVSSAVNVSASTYRQVRAVGSTESQSATAWPFVSSPYVPISAYAGRAVNVPRPMAYPMAGM